MRNLPLPGALLCVALAPALAFAQSGGAYNLDWHSLTGGGLTFAGGGAYTLGGAAGQHDAGPQSGGAYALAGGFWVGGPAGNVGVPAGEALPRVFAAGLAGPNPSSGASVLRLDLPEARRVRVALYGLDGRAVRVLLDGERGAGRHTVRWDGAGEDGRRAAPGIYFARIEAGASRASVRLVRLQ